MKAWEINHIIPLLSECGRIAMKYYDAPPVRVKADNTMVTAADREIEQLLCRELEKPGQIYFIGEETVATRSNNYLAEAINQRCWIVDPIDGTAPYSIHLPAWGISLAYMEDGIIREGALYSPATGELIITDGDAVLHATGSLSPEKLSLMPIMKRPCDRHSVISVSQHTVKHAVVSLPNQIFAWSGCVASFIHLLYGRLLGYVVGAKLWDIAGALPILQRQGFVILSSNGKPVGCDIREKFFNLEFGTADCWSFNGHAVVAPDENTATYISNGIKYL